MALPLPMQFWQKPSNYFLSVNDVNYWLEHLERIQQDRREGARKAAATRKKKQESTRARNSKRQSAGVVCVIISMKTKRMKLNSRLLVTGISVLVVSVLLVMMFRMSLRVVIACEV